MYTLKGVFPEPKKEQKKNFIKENMRQLKSIQSQQASANKFREPKYLIKSPLAPHSPQPKLNQVKSSTSGKLGVKSSSSSRKKMPVRIKKGDMAEFLKRKEMHKKQDVSDYSSDGEELQSLDSTSRTRDIGCQTIDANNLAQQMEDTKLTVLYPKKEDDKVPTDAITDVNGAKASGDNVRSRTHPVSVSPNRAGDQPQPPMHDYERPRSRLNSILERKDKDPYLPPGYQKGVLPKYLRERKEHGVKETEGLKADDESAVCPPGHVLLPDTERRETLRMLRNSFAELVNELNKMPVKTDTLRMRNRKMELEKQLAKLEEGIKVFSRPKVFVKIGE